jgi:hypothetical protein
MYVALALPSFRVAAKGVLVCDFMSFVNALWSSLKHSLEVFDWRCTVRLKDDGIIGVSFIVIITIPQVNNLPQVGLGIRHDFPLLSTS